MQALDDSVVRHVCDDDGRGCFLAALAKPLLAGVGGPSGEAFRSRSTGRGNGWAEARFLAPIFRSALNGSCTHRDGRPKTVVDVGANIGLYSLYFASMGCNVHSIEPLPLNAAHLQLAVRMNGFDSRVQVHRTAITSARNTKLVNMRWSTKETGLAHVHRATRNNYFSATPTRHDWQETAVPACRLDELLAPSLDRDISWLKMDVEGLELPAMCSGLATLQRTAHLSLEFNTDTTSALNMAVIRKLVEALNLEIRAAEGMPRWGWNQLLPRPEFKLFTSLFARRVPNLKRPSATALERICNPGRAGWLSVLSQSERERDLPEDVDERPAMAAGYSLPPRDER